MNGGDVRLFALPATMDSKLGNENDIKSHTMRHRALHRPLRRK